MYRGKKSLIDTRSCVLCGSIGESKQCGRLLHFRDKDWVHVNCALWSSEVYEEVDGSLQNVGQAVSRGLKLSCTICYKKGTVEAVFYQKWEKFDSIRALLYLCTSKFLFFGKFALPHFYASS